MENKKIITLLLGSPRIGGNTEKIADALAEGAIEKGYEVKKVHLAALTLKGCLDCRKCWSTGKPCIQNDDMDQVYPEIEEASVIAFVSPLYFYSWSSQIKSVWDRLLPYYMPGALRTTPSKKAILIAAGGDTEEKVFDGMRASFNDMPAVSLSNLVLEFKDYEEISQIQNGLLVTDVLGAHTANPISGDFSVEAMNAFKIQAGEVVYPVKKSMLSGNIFSMLKEATAASHQTRQLGPFITPPLTVSSLRVVG